MRFIKDCITLVVQVVYASASYFSQAVVALIVKFIVVIRTGSLVSVMQLRNFRDFSHPLRLVDLRLPFSIFNLL